MSHLKLTKIAISSSNNSLQTMSPCPKYILFFIQLVTPYCSRNQTNICFPSNTVWLPQAKIQAWYKQNFICQICVKSYYQQKNNDSIKILTLPDPSKSSLRSCLIVEDGGLWTKTKFAHHWAGHTNLIWEKDSGELRLHEGKWALGVRVSSRISRIVINYNFHPFSIQWKHS